MTIRSTGLAQDTHFLSHQTASDHPERPARLEAIAKRLSEAGLDSQCVPIPVSPIDMALVRRVHDSAYLQRLENACQAGDSFIDVADSSISPESFQIARLAAGTAINAVDAVMTEQIKNAFCAIRPPGHHAEHARSMGFCLFNNVAIAAQYLLDHHNISRVLILDWDVHHGNGTQHIFESDPRVLYISLHGHPSIVYPGSGYENEKGQGEGVGTTLNIPILPPGPDEIWRQAFDEKVIPAADDFKPEFVLVSAGFDGHCLDPLAPLELETESFGWMTDAVLGIAARHSRGRLVSLLEGGYHLDALADSVALHLEHLMAASHA